MAVEEDTQGSFSFYGNWRGEVVDVNDPAQAGRVRVRVFGVYDEVPDEHLPWASYADPMMGGQGGSGGFLIPPVGAKVWVFFENGEHMQPVYFAGAPSIVDGPPNKTINDEDDPRGAIQYGQNRVIRSPAGHVIELDDTAGQSRVRVVHKSGTQIIMYDNGDMYEQVMGNLKRVVKGNVEEIVNGTVTRSVVGKLTEQSGGGSNYWSAGAVDINGTTVDLNKGAAGVVQVNPYEGFIPSEQVQNTPRNASMLLQATGSSRAAFDDEDEVIPADFPPPSVAPAVEEPRNILTPGAPSAPLSPDCPIMAEVDYSYQLSPNYTVRDLSIGALFPHTVKSQGGLSVSDIVCNMKHLAVNILEPLRAQYPNIRINSGFRTGSGSSQHHRGQAVDIQVSGVPASFYSEMASWVARNLPFDQFIFEHGNSCWLHISFNRTLASQRGNKLTYWPAGSPQYKPGLKNYYDSGADIT